MKMTERPLVQHVIVYDSSRGKGIVYDTAYTDKQITRVVKNCAVRHGQRRGKVRSVLARDAG